MADFIWGLLPTRVRNWMQAQVESAMKGWVFVALMLLAGVTLGAKLTWWLVVESKNATIELLQAGRAADRASMHAPVNAWEGSSGLALLPGEMVAKVATQLEALAPETVFISNVPDDRSRKVARQYRELFGKADWRVVPPTQTDWSLDAAPFDEGVVIVHGETENARESVRILSAAGLRFVPVAASGGAIPQLLQVWVGPLGNDEE